MKLTLKRTLPLLILSALPLVSGCSKKSDAPEAGGSTQSLFNSTPKRYDLQSGIVTYEPMVIMGITSLSTLYFDDYGRREARETVTDSNIMGMKSHEKKVDITDGNYLISYEVEKMVNGKDETSKVATKIRKGLKFVMSKTMPMGGVVELTPAMENLIRLRVDEQLNNDSGYREEGTEVVAGVTGIKYSFPLNKEKTDARLSFVCYKKVRLKLQMGAMTIRAAKIEENASIPAAKFEVPSGYTIKDLGVIDYETIDLEKEMAMPMPGQSDN